MIELTSRESILAMTAEWTGERDGGGRPLVSDDLLQRIRLVTVEEAWGVLKKHGYDFQYEGNWWNVHPNRVLVGRAVTATFVPARPDLNAALDKWGRARNAVGLHNSWMIDTLVTGDVPVVDLFGKVRQGTFAGDNLGTAIANKTGVGMVIDGGIRDLARLQEIPGIAIFARGQHASAIADVSMVGLNVPVRIGEATCMPGDVVLGTVGGVVFIPPHLAQEVVESSELIRKQDEWGQMMIRAGKYTSGQVDGNWTDQMRSEFDVWYGKQTRP